MKTLTDRIFDKLAQRLEFNFEDYNDKGCVFFSVEHSLYVIEGDLNTITDSGNPELTFDLFQFEGKTKETKYTATETQQDFIYSLFQTKEKEYLQQLKNDRNESYEYEKQTQIDIDEWNASRAYYYNN